MSLLYIYNIIRMTFYECIFLYQIHANHSSSSEGVCNIFIKPQSFRCCDECSISNFYVLNCKQISIPHARIYADFPGQLHSLRFSTSPQTKTSLCCFISSPDRVCLNMQNTIFRLRITRRAAWLESHWSWSHASMWLRATALPECSLTPDCLEASFAL